MVINIDNENLKFLKNPDVVLREEGDEGALLFNPDSNQIKVLNTTALFIWKKCNGENKLSDILAELKENFEEVPLKDAEDDVADFLNEMVLCGFVGILEDI